jgi:hypothetical protein
LYGSNGIVRVEVGVKAFGTLILGIAIGGFAISAIHVGWPRPSLDPSTAFRDLRRLPAATPQARVQSAASITPDRAQAIQQATFALLTGMPRLRGTVAARKAPPVIVMPTALGPQDVPTRAVDHTVVTRPPGPDVIAAVTVGDLADNIAVARVETPTKGDLGYFRASAFGSCGQQCTSTVAACSESTRDPRSFTKADLKRMERERVELERVRSTIEGEFKRGKLGNDQYKRLMTRYQCGMRVYQTQMASYRRSAG